MKAPLPHSLTRLLNGAALIPLPVEIMVLNIPTESPEAKTRWKNARSDERRTARDARTDFSGAEYDLPF
ncbi:hypothetical protein [Rhizobium rhododendri]|uniref:Uncharacterized protein n=1 Tax=Rhizobium rhododendri TaxID=2506430 RepID=A0ABY8IKM6_9HYPH|nr:hypothetical protein [Rhizobium rhododendri]WFS23931.1 hypothetical protein PR018_05370 [Rhizobium rhododendri]